MKKLWYSAATKRWQRASCLRLSDPELLIRLLPQHLLLVIVTAATTVKPPVLQYCFLILLLLVHTNHNVTPLNIFLWYLLQNLKCCCTADAENRFCAGSDGFADTACTEIASPVGNCRGFLHLFLVLPNLCFGSAVDMENLKSKLNWFREGFRRRRKTEKLWSFAKPPSDLLGQDYKPSKMQTICVRIWWIWCKFNAVHVLVHEYRTNMMK